MQCLADFPRYLVHRCLRYVAGGVAAEQSEYARAAQVRLQAGLAGDDVEVNVSAPAQADLPAHCWHS